MKMKAKWKPVPLNWTLNLYFGWRAMGVMRVMGLMRIMGLMRRKQKNKTTPAQRDSEISILKTSPYRPYRPYRRLAFKTTPAQLDSKMSNRRLSWVSCWPHGQTSPAERGSKIAILGLENIVTQSAQRKQRRESL